MVKDNPNMFFTTYEEMSRDLRAVALKLIRFLGKGNKLIMFLKKANTLKITKFQSLVVTFDNIIYVERNFKI